MTNQNQAKRRRNGQYSHGFDVVCTCGATKGEHMAEAPFDLDRTGCEAFKKAKPAR